jgi:hypothetical protein
VRVVHHYQQRPALGEVRGEPVQAVLAGERGLRTARLVRQLQRRGGQPGRAAEQLGPLVRRAAPQHGLEELAHHAVGEAALPLVAPGGQHPHAGGERGPLGGLDEPRLADPGPPLDEQRAARAVERGAHPALDHRELGFPLEQPAGHQLGPP